MLIILQPEFLCYIYIMFYFEEFNDSKILKSDFISDVTAYFTTRGEVHFPESKRIISPLQTHSDHIAIVDSSDNYPDTDGLIITNTDDTIYLKFADCTPLIFYAPIKKVGAVSHAGWRGTAAKISVKTIYKMKSLGCKIEDIIALIGPAISVCCYEVSEEVRDKLLETVSDTNGLFSGRNVDLKNINARQLEEAGIKNIDICPYCTSCNNDLFYSYRKENGTPNRHYAVLNLNPLV